MVPKADGSIELHRRGLVYKKAQEPSPLSVNWVNTLPQEADLKLVLVGLKHVIVLEHEGRV